MYVLLEMGYIHLDGGVKWRQIGEALHMGSWLTFITTHEIKLDMVKCNVQSCQELERYICQVSFSCTRTIKWQTRKSLLLGPARP
jgi:hypothetical protein